MSEILSQDQIDALLSAGGFGGGSAAGSGGGADQTPGGDDRYQSLEKTFGLFCKNASTVLTTVINKKVEVQLNVCSRADMNTVKNTLNGEMLSIELPFTTGVTGEAYLYFLTKDVAALADLMMMGDGSAAFSPEHKDAITELTNQMASAFTLALSGEVGTQVAVSPCKIVDYTLEKTPLSPEQLDMVVATLSIEGREESGFVLLIPEPLAAELAQLEPSSGSGDESLTGGMEGLSGGGFDSGDSFRGGVDVPSFGGGGSSKHKDNVEMLLDVDLDVSIELGRSLLSIKRILELAPGSIVELDRMAGEPVDLLVNNKVVAKGEVVVIDENFGIRILSLVSAEERIRSLR